jgi:hypothetical protein
MFAWYVYFSKEVKYALSSKYRLPDALCRVIASFALGISYIQDEADKIRDFRMTSILLAIERNEREDYSRVMNCRDFYWARSFTNRVESADNYYMDYSRCRTSCKLTVKNESNLEEMSLWNLKLVGNMFDFLFEANTSTTYDNCVLHEIKIAMCCLAEGKRPMLPCEYHMFNHLYENLCQITRGKQSSMWYGADKYTYGYFGTPTAVIILQHIEDINNDMFDQGYKFGQSYRESHRCTLWRNRIFSRQSANLKDVVLHLIPYAQFSSLAAVNELLRVASRKNYC